MFFTDHLWIRSGGTARGKMISSLSHCSITSMLNTDANVHITAAGVLTHEPIVI